MQPVKTFSHAVDQQIDDCWVWIVRSVKLRPARKLTVQGATLQLAPAPCQVRGVLLPAKVDQAAGHKHSVVRYERHLPDGHLSGRSGRVREVLARSETVGMSGQLTNTNVQTARGVISVEDPRVMLVRSLHGPPSPDSLPGDIAQR